VTIALCTKCVLPGGLNPYSRDAAALLEQAACGRPFEHGRDDLKVVSSGGGEFG
jgi:hypothetical protein